jgi:hypothetical protein
LHRDTVLVLDRGPCKARLQPTQGGRHDEPSAGRIFEPGKYDNIILVNGLSGDYNDVAALEIGEYARRKYKRNYSMLRLAK